MALTESVDEIVENSNNPLLGKHESWARVRLGEIADIQNGFAFKSAKFSKQQGLPLIRIRDVVQDDTETFYTGEYEPEYMVQPGDLLVGMDGDFNCARWRGSPGLLNQRVCRINLKSDLLHPRLLDYALPGYLRAINDKTSSVTVKHLSSKTIADIPLPVPPPAQQQLMVAEIEKQFSRLDEAVASLKRVKANLKRYKAAVLKAAVEGKLTEEWRKQNPGVEPASKLLERILAERRKKWEEAEHAKMKGNGKEPKDDRWREKFTAPTRLDAQDLPKLPEKWSFATLDEIGQEGRPILYGIIKPGPHIPDGVPYVRVTEMKDGNIDVGSLRRASPERAAKFARALLKSGDILISKDGTIGRVAIVPPEVEGANITQHVMRAPISSEVSNTFVAWAIRSPFCQSWLTGETKGVALRGVNVEDFRRLPIPIPSFHEQKEIVSEIEARLSVMERLEIAVDVQLARIASTRHSSLVEAFAGRLTVAATQDA